MTNQNTVTKSELTELLHYRKNQHTLKLTLTDEQTGEEYWGDYEITFYNEDNAISHLNIVGDFMGLLAKEENRKWGFYHTTEEIVNNIIDPIKKKLRGDFN
jgi:hypothetical protein